MNIIALMDESATELIKDLPAWTEEGIGCVGLDGCPCGSKFVTFYKDYKNIADQVLHCPKCGKALLLPKKSRCKIA